jgi:hypothetical protein
MHAAKKHQVTASVVPTSPILVTLMKEALNSSKTLVRTRATRRNIPEDAIIHSHRRENLKSYKSLLESKYYPRIHFLSRGGPHTICQERLGND